MVAWPDWLRFDPHPFAAKIAQPTLVVHSEKAAIPAGAKKFLENLGGEKRAHWMPGAQFDFYDSPETVAAAVAQVTAHLEAHAR